MQQNKTNNYSAKFIAVVFVLLLLVSYIFIRNNESKKEASLEKLESSSGVEADSLKRLEIYGNSAVNWGMNPFGSGKPLTEEEHTKFKMPNLEWKTRTLSGVTYVFGAGNPKEFSMNEDELKEFWKNGGSLYMQPRAEEDMKNFLSNENMANLKARCGDSLHLPDNMDLNTVLYIDQKTGRKEFKEEFMAGTEDAFADFDDQNKITGWNNCISLDEYNEMYIPLRNLYLESTDNYRLKSPQPN